MVFVDTWAWLALAIRKDQHHAAAACQHGKFVAAGRKYVTTDYVLCELITQLYRCIAASQAEAYVNAVLKGISDGAYRLEQVDAARFDEAWKLRTQYADKPSIPSWI